MAKAFKDFNKDVKDLLSKNYQKPGEWKVEHKVKAADKTITINPVATNSTIAIDVEYNCKDCGLETKTNLQPDGTFKPKVTYKKDGHKIDVSTHFKCPFIKGEERICNYELGYEGTVAGVLITDTLTKKDMKFTAAYPIVKQLTVGCAATLCLKDKKLSSWQAGARFADAGRVAAVTMNELKGATTGAMLPFCVAGVSGKAAMQVDCAKGKDVKVQAGVEFACPLIKGNTMRVKVDNKLNGAIAVIRKFGDVKVAVSMEFKKIFDFGVLVTRE